MIDPILGAMLLSVIIWLVFILIIMLMLYFVIKKAIVDAIKKLKKDNIL